MDGQTDPLAPVRLSPRGVPAKGNTAPVLESLHSSEEMVSKNTPDTDTHTQNTEGEHAERAGNPGGRGGSLACS